MDEPRIRPRWKKKRWVAAGALWLAAVPFGAGPVWYGYQRDGWLPDTVRVAAWDYYGSPIWKAIKLTPVSGAFSRYMRWWYWRAIDDNAAAYERKLNDSGSDAGSE